MVSKSVSVKKEIGLGWLVSFIAGGVLNFAVLVWTAATLVSQVEEAKADINRLDLRVNSLDVAVARHETELQRQQTIDEAMEKVLVDNLKRIERNEEARSGRLRYNGSQK